MAVLLQDNFDRANSTTVIGSPQVGPAPVVRAGVGGISSNQLYGPTAALLVTYNLGTKNVALEADLVIGGFTEKWIGFVFGFTSVTDYWQIIIDSSVQGSVQRKNPGGTAFYFSVFPVAPATVRVRVEHYEGLFSVFMGGNRVARYEIDQKIASTVHGLRLGNSYSRLDNLVGEDSVLPSDYTVLGDSASADLVSGGQSSVLSSFLYRGRDTKTQDIAGVV